MISLLRYFAVRSRSTAITVKITLVFISRRSKNDRNLLSERRIAWSTRRLLVDVSCSNSLICFLFDEIYNNIMLTLMSIYSVCIEPILTGCIYRFSTCVQASHNVWKVFTFCTCSFTRPFSREMVEGIYIVP